MTASSPFDLSGKRALVTGSTRGIGAAIAGAFARSGAQVIVHGRDPERVEMARLSLSTALASKPGSTEPLAVSFDVGDYAAMLHTAAHLEEQLGGIDILVNNAGIQHRAALLDFPLDAWESVISANLTSCFLLSQQVARGMITRGHGKIINVCSVQNKLVRGATAAYAAAKAALGTLSQVMCADWAAHGLQINGLAPGYIETDLNRALLDDAAMSEWVAARTPARRWGVPSDLAGPAVWLASDASNFVNGQVIFVDGGMTAVI